ncbi:MAG: tRNA (5-methylaminomethyl-2-thiouridylate)-methyltransferase [Chromatiales bacterium]|jgi:tRNA-uridine 2-sulfurtransferase|nr:tRNA (5-methylaminomethyl-2-thiouridylate)-methyltransferase [Chromatiales bacterium]
MSKQRKAVALMSGGLDSMLAARVIKDQGVHVEGINFFTGFCVEGHTQAIRKKGGSKPKRNNALWSAEQVGVALHFVDVVEEYKDVVLNPKHGYGRNLNPCLDCKGFMVGKAHEWMLENDFDFIITGEVIGQRPMSQRRATMPIIAAESGAGDRLLRPLSAQMLEPTLPEREGWVVREQLFGWNGRSRRPQMALAESYGFEEYAQPAGGCCFLTDKQYTVKLQDLWNSRHERRYELDDIMLLKVGRHLRPAPGYKLIVGREDGENQFLRGYRKEFLHLRTVSHLGPLALVDGECTQSDIEVCAQLVARYSQGRDAEQVEVEVVPVGEQPWQLKVTPLAPGDIPAEWIL